MDSTCCPTYSSKRSPIFSMFVSEKWMESSSIKFKVFLKILWCETRTVSYWWTRCYCSILKESSFPYERFVSCSLDICHQETLLCKYATFFWSYCHPLFPASLFQVSRLTTLSNGQLLYRMRDLQLDSKQGMSMHEPIPLMMTKKLKTQCLLLTIKCGWSCENYRGSIADPYSTNTIGGTNAIMACRSLIGHWGKPLQQQPTGG